MREYLDAQDDLRRVIDHLEQTQSYTDRLTVLWKAERDFIRMLRDAKHKAVYEARVHGLTLQQISDITDVSAFTLTQWTKAWVEAKGLPYPQNARQGPYRIYASVDLSRAARTEQNSPPDPGH